MFIDEVVVTFKAGKWGDGIVSWRREKYIPNGGPYGGDGGNGGSVLLRATANMNTLSDFRHTKVLRARDGERGGIKEMHGANGEDLIVDVPVGTIVTDAETGALLYDLDRDGQMVALCQGGRGGFGNAHFPSSVRQAPNFAEMGDVGEQQMVKLELKLVADIGIIGLPNAGKSTFIQSVTNVRPKIADYPFTTLIPNLGVMEYKGQNLVLEDVPGLIPGASDGKGLGIRFLKHIERTRVLLHLLDITEWADTAFANYEAIRKELKQFSADVMKKDEIIVLSKSDVVGADELSAIEKDLRKRFKGQKVFVMSAATRAGLDELKDYLIAEYAHREDAETSVEIEQDNVRIYDLKNQTKDESFKIMRTGDREFTVTGERIEQIVRMTNMQSFEAVARVYDILEKLRILTKIRTMLFSDMQEYFFEWSDHADDDLGKIVIAGRVFPLEKTIFGKR